jgi:hypothetical protein
MDKHERKEIYGYENIQRKGIKMIIWIVLVVLPFLEMVPNGSIKGCLYPTAKDCSLVTSENWWKKTLGIGNN